jgi:hypothetical protein
MHSLLDFAWYSYSQALGGRVVGGFLGSCSRQHMAHRAIRIRSTIETLPGTLKEQRCRGSMQSRRMRPDADWCCRKLSGDWESFERI